MRLYQILLLLFLFFAFIPNVLAAPDPIEVKELKSKAPLYIEGVIVADVLLEDLKKDQTQTRKISVEMEEIYQNTLPSSFRKGQIIEVQYHYLPTWSDYVGGGSIQVKKGDKVKLWLKRKDSTFTPILGYYGVEVLKKNGSRIEHIQEPFLHKIQRVWWVSWLNYSPVIIFLFLSIVLIIILRASYRNMR